ncbi:MAG: FAD:protein FMN transferase [Polyangiales bacterium]
MTLVSRFRAMATEVTLVTASHTQRDHDRALRDARALFTAFERRFSRFDPASELSRLNRAARAISVSPELFAAIQRCRAHFEATRGLFDPTIARALEQQGYDRSRDAGPLDRDERALPARVPTMNALILDAPSRTVTLRDGAQLDLGGIAKGLCVDECAAILPANCALDAGGDAILRGRDAEGLPWLVEIEDPRDASRVIANVELTDVAVATSATNRRRWKRGPDEHHHLIDPRTGASAASDLAQVTVIDRSAARAEVLSKSALIAGSIDARSLLESAKVRAVLVTRDGERTTVGPIEFVCE